MYWRPALDQQENLCLRSLSLPHHYLPYCTLVVPDGTCDNMVPSLSRINTIRAHLHERNCQVDAGEAEESGGAEEDFAGRSAVEPECVPSGQVG